MSLILLGILNSQVSGAGAAAYDLLETQVLASSAASVTFTGLGSYSDYKHLQIRAVIRKDSGFTTDGVSLNVNGITTASYTFHKLEGVGGSVNSSGSTSQFSMLQNTVTGGGAAANAFGALVIDLLDFADANKNPVFRTLTGATTGTSSLDRIGLFSGLYPSPTAVTSITIGNSGLGGNMVAGTRISLYGIR